MPPSTQTVRTRLTSILDRSVTPLLKPEGFSATKYVYTRRFANMAWIIDVQLDPNKTAEKADFTLNCGVYLAGVTSSCLNRPEPQSPDVMDCTIFCRIGAFADNGLDTWWTVHAGELGVQSESLICEDIPSRLLTHVLPFLQRFSTAESLLEFLTTPRDAQFRRVWPTSDILCDCYAAIIALQLDRRTEATALLFRAKEESLGSPIEEFVSNLFQRLHHR